MSGKERFKINLAAYLILEKDGKVLLHLRKNSGFADGFYSLVAGHLEGNETVTQAIMREAKEEAGIEIKKEDLKIVHIMHRSGNKEYIDIYLHCDHWSGEIQNLEPHKCGGLLFADKTNLPEKCLGYVKYAIEKSQRGIFFSEFGW